MWQKRPRQKALRPRRRFFGTASARRLKAAGVAPDLMVANNVLAHVHDLNDFVAAFALLLKPEGVLSIECPHLLRLLAENQFDTIYHEHFSYFSLHVIRRVLAFHGLRVFDVEPLPTHGGSLRIFATHAACTTHPETAAVAHMLHAEIEAGLESGAAYKAFAQRVVEAKCALLRFLIAARAEGKNRFRLRRTGKGQYAAQLLRHRAGTPTIHRRPLPAQAGLAAARHTHPGARARRDHAGKAGLPADPAMEFA